MHANHPPPAAYSERTGAKLRKAGLTLLVVMLILAAWGIYSRHETGRKLKAAANERATVTVVTTNPRKSAADATMVLPGTVQAYIEAPIYARANGYIKSWSTDIGGVVKKGTVLAEIDSPETDDQLRQAEADFATAEANNVLAQSTAKRWLALLATDSVTHQETDEKVSDAAAKQAALASAKANLERLRALENFKHVVAPFDGVVTARQIDVGSLINAGNGGTGQLLFRLADISRLRIYVQVPQSASSSIAVNMQADLRFAEHPGTTYPASVVRTADALDPTARTLLVELGATNPKGTLFPGSYTEVHFRMPTTAGALRLPINTLLFRADGLRAARVDASGKVNLVPLTVGRDFGTEIEVLQGVAPTDNIIVNPPDSLTEGQVVHIASAAPSGPEK